MAFPDRPVIVGCGDGCDLLSGFELLTAVRYNLPVIWIPRGRQRVSFARWPEGARRRALEDPHRRTETRQRLFAVAWRRRGARGGLWQPQPIEIGCRQAGHAQARRNGRA